MKNSDTAVPQHSLGFEVVANAAWVINETTRFRLQGNLAGKLHAAFIIIGHTGCGDYYFLDLGQMPNPVMLFNHETSEVEFVAPSVSRWLKRIAGETKPQNS